MDVLPGPECLTGEHFFTFMAGNFPAPGDVRGRSRLFVAIEIPYDNLQFVKQDSVYCAECAIRVQLANHEGKVIGRRNWSEKRSTGLYSDTNSRDMKLDISGFIDVSGGDYVLHIEVMDRDTKKPFHEEAPVFLKDFSGRSGVVSSIMLLKGAPPSPFWENVPEIIVSDVFDIEEEDRLVAICFSTGIPDSVDAFFCIRNQGGGLVTRFQASVVVLPDSQVSRIAANLPVSDLPAGEYSFLLERGGFSVSTRVNIRSGIFADLSLSVEQMIYVADGEELDRMRLAEGNEKLKLFEDFWKKKSTGNENGTRMTQEEYYGRVAFADKHFKETREGWRTDRGMIYIKFGSPDDIDSHPFDIDSRGYEIWYYYRLGKTFYFSDLRGTGEYLLIRRRD